MLTIIVNIKKVYSSYIINILPYNIIIYFDNWGKKLLIYEDYNIIII